MCQNSISFHYEAFHSETLQNHGSANVWVEQALLILVSLFIPFWCRAPAVLARTQQTCSNSDQLLLLRKHVGVGELKSKSQNVGCWQQMLCQASFLRSDPCLFGRHLASVGIRFLRLQQLKLKVSYYTCIAYGFWNNYVTGFLDVWIQNICISAFPHWSGIWSYHVTWYFFGSSQIFAI